MSNEKMCPQCGATLPAETPEALCPACLLRRGFDTQTAGGQAAANVPPPTPEALAARFPQLEIVELLGRGGMGVVYKARHRGLDRWVALKILPAAADRDPAFAERFSREARALAKLDHPNIVSVFDSGEADGLFYFIMEYVDGANLRQVLAAGGMKPEQALAIVPQICEALQYAHDQGIVHRDIKPENILVDKSGRVKIADFGLAKIVGIEARDFTLTGVGEVMGTPAYMAPEQVEHPSEVDHRADIYSLGVVFYQMLTGELPLGRFAPPSRKVQIDVRLDEVVLRTLEKEPGLRYQQAGELKTEVETIAGSPQAGEGKSSSGASAPEAPMPDTRQPWRWRVWPPLVGRRNDQRLINWPAVAMCSLIGLLVLLFLCIAFNGVIINSNERFLSTWSYFEVGVVLLSLVMAIRLLRGFAAPLAQLSILDKPASGPSGRSKTWILSIVMICAVLAILTRLFVLAPYRVPTDAVLPEIPRGSQLLVFKLGRDFVPGDFVIYRQGREERVARVAQAPAHGVLQIARHNEPLQEIPVSSVIGKVILNTRPERLAAPSYTPQNDSDSNVRQTGAAARLWVMSDKILNDIQPNGTIRIKSTLEKVNLTGETVARDRIVSSRLFGNPPKVLDAQGRSMAVEVKPLKDYYEWWVTLNEPVRPGGIISWVFPEETVTGEIKKVSDFGLYEYSMKHWPAVSGFTRYEALYRLPAGAEVTEKFPAEMTQEIKEGRTELRFDQMIPAGGFVEIRFRYHLPTQPPAASQSKRQRFEPKAGMEDKANWSVEDKPSIFNPIGWASMMRLTLGGKASVRMPGDTEDTCRIKLIDGDDDKIRLTIEDVKKKNVLTLTLNRNQDAEILVNGQGYRVRYLAPEVANDQPDTSPFASVLLARLEPKTFGPMMERVIEPTNPTHRALNLATGEFATPSAGHPLDFWASGTTSLREAGVDLFLQEGTSSPGMLTTLDMQFCVKFQPPSGDAVNLETFTADELQALLGGSERFQGWQARSAVNIPASDLNSRLSTISGTDLYLFVTRDHVSGVLEIMGPSENPQGMMIRYKLVQNGAMPVKPPQKPTEAEPELFPVERFQSALQQAVDSQNKEAVLALFNSEGVDAETKESIAPIIDRIISWPGVKVEYRRRPESEPALSERDGKKYTLNGLWTLNVAFNNTAPAPSQHQGYTFPGGQTPKGMRILLQVEASQPAAASANAISKAEKGLFEIHGVANAAGPTTTDCSLPPRNGKTEIVHLESAVLLDQNSLRSVKVEHDENCYYLRLTLDEEGAKRFGDITARRIDKRIGIVADGKLLSAPVVKDPIFGGSIMITGNITEKEANDLAAKLNNAIRMSPSAASETQKPTPSPSPSSAPSPAAAKSQEELKNHAVAFVDLLAKGDFAKARSEFDATMTSAMSEQMLATVWEQLQTGGGKYLGHDAPRQETFGEFTLIYVPCRWERTRLDLKVVYDKAGKVSGFWVVPPGASIHGSSPAPK